MLRTFLVSPCRFDIICRARSRITFSLSVKRLKKEKRINSPRRHKNSRLKNGSSLTGLVINVIVQLMNTCTNVK